MAAADVELLALRALGLLGARSVQVGEAAEEQRGVAQVGQRLDAVVDLAGETSALTQFAVTSLMSSDSASSRMARSAEREEARWERSRASGSSVGVDRGCLRKT